MTFLPLFFSLAAASTPIQTAPESPERTPAQIHVGHVMEAINGTPEGVGLLAVVSQEAEIAARHAQLALSDPSNLESVQKHLHHVRNAIDPGTEAEGPGKGYGVLKAAEGVETHILLATKSRGATDNIKTHATHVAASAVNVVSWSKLILAECEKAIAASSPEDAAAAARKVSELTRQILDGTDANGDGKASWEKGEGGIAQVRQHMELLVAGEAAQHSTGER